MRGITLPRVGSYGAYAPRPIAQNPARRICVSYSVMLYFSTA